MIEYIYSRAIFFLASTAIVAMVFSATTGSINNRSHSYAELLSEKIAESIESAGRMETQRYIQRNHIDPDGFHPQLKVWLLSDRVVVSDGKSNHTKCFNIWITLKEDGEEVHSIIAYSKNILVIIAATEMNENKAEVVVEMLTDSLLPDRFS